MPPSIKAYSSKGARLGFSSHLSFRPRPGFMWRISFTFHLLMISLCEICLLPVCHVISYHLRSDSNSVKALEIWNEVFSTVLYSRFVFQHQEEISRQI